MALVNQFRQILCGIALSALAMAPAVAARDNYATDSDYEGLAVAIDRDLPDFPRQKRRWTQEAWVRLSYVVTADGQAVDPIVINSSGGIDFENEVRKVTERWRFKPSDTGAELPYNIANMRFVIRGRGKGTTRKFARYAKHIMKNLHGNNVEVARRHADEAVEIGGWNLYESTILWLMLGRIEGAEGNDPGKLEMYRRGLAVSDSRSLRRNARIDLLEDIFELESKLHQYAAAMVTLETLSDVRGSSEVLEHLSARSAAIVEILDNQDVVAAQATVSNPCNCDDGVALWDYIPIRRTFSFANLNGNVERFEARCERQRISGVVETDQKWTLAADWGNCQVFVFGDDGATFDFLGHLPDSEEDQAIDRTAVARNYVLDRRD